ncbi:MAG: RpiR family transcriptional regulator [marine bacterium B5-7]|nr:MAG: RpiR family transcriptional regulator [marine bacterium B5-7]
MKSVFSSHPQVENFGVSERIQSLLDELPRQEARVAQYMLLNVNDLVFQNGASIARKAGASEVTVSRLLRRLGYRGMVGLKRELRSQQAEANLDIVDDHGINRLDPTLKQVLDNELRALVAVFSQTTDPRWMRAIRAITQSEQVFVTGFQSVRGVAEDLSRRLALVRDDVRFFSAHDGMLGEWVGDMKKSKQKDCVIIVDVIPYAMEAPLLAQMCREAGRQLVVLTDELCHWAQANTDLIFHGPSRHGMAIESTVALTSLANLMVDAVARTNPEVAEQRMQRWHKITRKLNVF